MRMLLSLAIAMVLSLFSNATAEVSHMKATLISDVTAAAPGKAFNVAVKFAIDPGWHIYWSNPGDSGMATTVEFSAPTGFKISDVRYPVPTRFDQAGDEVAYGYEGEVLLMATLTPPADFKEASVDLKAKACWLVCKEMCLPGEQTLSAMIEIKAEPQANADGAKLIETWSASVPVDGGDIAHSRTTKNQVILSAKLPAATKDAQWFPPALNTVQFAKPVVNAHEFGWVIYADYKILKNQKIPDGELRGVLVYTDADGKRRGVVTPFRLDKTE